MPFFNLLDIIFYMPNLFDLGGMESLVKSENVGRGKYKRFVDKTIKDMDTKMKPYK